MGATTQTTRQRVNISPPGSLERSLTGRVTPTIEALEDLAGRTRALGGQVGGILDRLIGEIGDLPTARTLADLALGGRSPEQRALISRTRRGIVRERTEGAEGLIRDLLENVMGGDISDAVRSGTRPTGVPAGVEEILGQVAGQIQTGTPSSFDISRTMGADLAGLRQRNLAELGEFANLAGALGGQEQAQLGLASDIGARQIGISAQERIAGAERISETSTSQPFLNTALSLGLTGAALGGAFPGFFPAIGGFLKSLFERELPVIGEVDFLGQLPGTTDLGPNLPAGPPVR